ncbi:MAG: hypothetical protein ILP23_00090 [Paludibacteraceae bacterium]|nr:hypothetical protein [Paludibacteraceae bacterium]
MRKLTLEGATIIALVGIIPTAMASHKAAVTYITVWLVLLLVALIKNIRKEI